MASGFRKEGNVQMHIQNLIRIRQNQLRKTIYHFLDTLFIPLDWIYIRRAKNGSFPDYGSE